MAKLVFRCNMRPATVGAFFCSIIEGRLIIWHKITNRTGDRMANDPVQCCAFDIGCAGTDTALWQLFCPRGLVFFVFQDFYSWQYSAKNCQSFGVKRPKNMDLKTSFAINQIYIIGKLCLISMSHQFA